MSTADIDIAGCRYVVLSGGIGGAKLAQGLSLCRPAEELLVVGNIGDDFEHWGLHISPDLDTLMYTLAGVAELGLKGFFIGALTKVSSASSGTQNPARRNLPSSARLGAGSAA